MRFNVTGGHAFGVHGQNLLLDVLADAGLIFPQHLGVKFALAIPRHRYLYIAKTGAQGFAAVPVPAVIRVLVLVVIPVVAQLIVQLGLQTVFHELRDSVLEQFLNVILLLFYTLLEVYTKFGMKSARSTVTTACSCVYPSLGRNRLFSLPGIMPISRIAYTLLRAQSPSWVSSAFGLSLAAPTPAAMLLAISAAAHK